MCAAGLAACGTSDASTDAVSEASSDLLAQSESSSGSRVELSVVAEEARDGDLVLRVTTTGQVRSDAVVRLRTEVTGAVAEVLVRPGQAVKRGQPLVRLEDFPFDLSVREAQAAVNETEQRFLESFVPESLVTGIGPTSDQRKALRIRSGVEVARLRLERAEWERERAVITSPVDGYVDQLDVAPGERLATGAQVATVVDLRNLRIEAQVLEHDLPLVRAGGEATITTAALPGTVLRGRIEAVLPLVDSLTRAGRAVVRVPANNVLRPGMYADVQLEAQRLTGRRLVPARSVIERDGRPLVFVVRDGRAQWTYIEPGRSNGVDTEVLPDSVSGTIPVEPGDQVIVDGHLTLTHDAPVALAVLRDTDRAEPRRPPSARRGGN